MLDAAFVKTLVCPETHQPLRAATAEEIERLNRAIAAGGVQDRRGRPVRQPLQEGLIRSDASVLYPVVQGIPMLVMDEGLVLPNGVVQA